MAIFEQNVETLRSHLEFLRKKVQQYLLLLLLLVFLSFATATVFKIISESSRVALAASLQKAANAAIKIKLGDDCRSSDDKNNNSSSIFEVKDLSALNERSTEDAAFRSEYVYAISVAFLVMAVIGLIRHHLRRVAIVEDRLFLIEKLYTILNSDRASDPAILAFLNEDGLANVTQTAYEPPLHPAQEILERSINALSEISKIAVKKAK